MCHWIGSHFHDWIDYNGVTFSKQLQELTRMGSHIFEIWQVGILSTKNMGRFVVTKTVSIFRAVV